jgi:hypothetical protein
MEITFNAKFKCTDRVLILSSKAHNCFGVIEAIHFTQSSVSSNVGYSVQVMVKDNLLCSSKSIYVGETALISASGLEGQSLSQSELDSFSILLEEKKEAEITIARVEAKLKERFSY